MHPDGKGAGEDLVGVEEKERVIRKYCLKISTFIKRQIERNIIDIKYNELMSHTMTEHIS